MKFGIWLALFVAIIVSVLGLTLFCRGVVDYYSSFAGESIDNQNTYILARVVGILLLFIDALIFTLFILRRSTVILAKTLITQFDIITQRQWLIFVFVLALLLRITWILIISNESYSDWRWYSDNARNLILHGQYGYPEPTAYRAPGYTIFLAGIYKIFGFKEVAGQIANGLFNSINCILLYFIGKKVSRLVGKISSIMLALYPTHILISSYLCSDVLYTTVLLIVVLYFSGFIKSDFLSTDKIVAGLILALGSLYIRPLFLLFFVPFIYFLRRQGRVPYRKIGKYLLIYAGLFCLIIAPWWIRNYVVFDRFIPYTTELDHAILTQAVYTDGMLIAYELGEQGQSELESHAEMRKMGIEYMIRNPWTYIKRKIIQAGPFIYPDQDYIVSYQFNPPNRFSQCRYKNIIKNFTEYIAVTGYSIMLILFLMGIYFYRKERPALAFSLIMIIYISLFTMVGVYGHPRMRFPIEPLMMLFASLPLVKFIECLKGGDVRNRLAMGQS